MMQVANSYRVCCDECDRKLSTWQATEEDAVEDARSCGAMTLGREIVCRECYQRREESQRLQKT